MLGVFPVKDAARDTLPATTHVDGTARVQVVNETDSPLFGQLLLGLSARRPDISVSCSIPVQPRAAS